MRSPQHASFGRGPAPASRPDGSAHTLIGIVEWFPPGEKRRAEEILTDLRELEVTELRTGISRADFQTAAGAEWYDWLLPRLASQVNVLPCLAQGPAPPNGSPPAGCTRAEPAAYERFVDAFLARFGSLCEYVQLSSEPGSTGQSDGSAGTDWATCANTIRRAALVSHRHGKHTVLAGPSTVDPNWLRLMFQQEVMDHIEVVGVHGYPGVWESNWEGWKRVIERVQAVLDEHHSEARIWITETGYSTVRHNLLRQAQLLLSAIESNAERVYWYAARDPENHNTAKEPACVDERELHFGLKTASGRHKLLSRMWAEHGIEGVYQLQKSARRLPQPSARRYALITGGAGFIGSNLANRLLKANRHVMIFDSLARPGVERNLEWLHDMHGDRLIVEIADVRNAQAVQRAVNKAEQVFDFSAQVAVTTSLVDPLEDFEINARGTLNLLEAIRTSGRRIPMIFTSTNKVYGSLSDVRLRSFGDRYEPVSRCLRMQGIDEGRSLEFHSPYGCSKGSADQYVLDYARTMGLAALVFRMSCIYGPRQFGTEDQGWVAHFLIRAMQGLPITLYGDGRQVRDILYVEDLLDAFELAQANMDSLSGRAFNIGGGPPRTISLLELIRLIEELSGEAPLVRYEDWRPADQRYYVSNTLRFQRATGWGPRVGIKEGVHRLYEWLCAARAPGQAAQPTECVGS